MQIKFVAALLLSPLMVHAQTNSSAQTPATTRVSTGVVAPKLIHQVAMLQTAVSPIAFGPRDREATVSMIVDATGKPANLKIVQSAGQGIDQSVLQMVSQYQFQPATVSGQAIAAPVELHVVIQSPTE
jgi:TonB family protein